MGSKGKRSRAQTQTQELDPAIYIPSNGQPIAEDRICKARNAPVIKAEAVPDPPESYLPLSSDERMSGLQSIAEDLQAESLNALRELSEKGDGVQKDLGPRCPSSNKAKAQLARTVATRAALRRSRALLEYLEDLDRVNRHDNWVLLNEARSAFNYFRKGNGSLPIEYPALAYLIRAQAEKIAEGRSQAKRVRGIQQALTEAEKTLREAGIEEEKKGIEEEKKGIEDEKRSCS